MGNPHQASFEDITGCQEALFEWADSYDAKDWSRLRACVAPLLRVDYRSFLNMLWEQMPADDFVKMAADAHFLGDPTIKTQHFVGLSRWHKTSEHAITGTHQLRVAHQRYEDASLTKVTLQGHAHGTGTVWYERVDGVWKFAGVQPNVRWSEFDYEQIFAQSSKAMEDGKH